MRQPALSEPGFHPRAVETSSFSPRRALLLLLLFLPWIHGAPKKKARFGWCAGKHPARKPAPAQSGYVDRAGNRYCKACFREKFPALYKAKQSGRKKLANDVVTLLNSPVVSASHASAGTNARHVPVCVVSRTLSYVPIATITLLCGAPSVSRRRSVHASTARSA